MSAHKVSFKIIVALFLLSAIVRGAGAQTPDGLQMFLQNEYAGLSVRVYAPPEIIPGDNLTVNLWINCTATGVTIDNFNLSIYGFRGGQERIQLTTLVVMSNSSLDFNYTKEENYVVSVPVDVWGATYAELHFEYSIFSSNLSGEGHCWMTVVRNIYYEQLQEDYKSLNESYWQLNSLFEQLNQTYWELQQQYKALEENYTTLQGSVNDVSGTRELALLLGITTVFFLGTTIYLLTRKPRGYW